MYFLLGNLPKAKQYVNSGLRVRENRFLADLKIQIAIAEGQEQEARQGLVQLEAMDSQAFVWHRLSTVELRFGNYGEALRAAEQAVATVEGRPPFGVLAQLMTCQTREGHHEEADVTLQKINRSYGNQKADIRFGLECRLEIERKRFPKALSVLTRIQEPSTQVYTAMKRDALAGILQSVLPDAERIAYEKELGELEAMLRGFDPTTAWLKLIK